MNYYQKIAAWAQCELKFVESGFSTGASKNISHPRAKNVCLLITPHEELNQKRIKSLKRHM
jgi:hypothetical protein